MGLAIRLAFCLVSLVVFVGGTPSFPIKPSVRLTEKEEDFQIRLLNDTVPIHYDFYLTTRINEGDFFYNGLVNIRIKCEIVTNKITLHNRRSEINGVTVTSGETNYLATFSILPDSEFLQINLQQNLVVGQEYLLSIDFTGEHSTDRFGWYRASYNDDDGNLVWFATTDFQPSNARQAFPCYDAPDHKATYSFYVTHHPSYHAMSNMPISFLSNGDGTVTTVFQVTPKMSTYLLAIVVSPYASRCKADSKGRNHCVHMRPSRYDESSWALETSLKALTSLEDLFQTDFSMPKMDQIAIQNKDFFWGGMENWGLVVYSETSLLLDEKDYRYVDKDYVSVVILHEYTHQWFGDLVSPKWWTYLWLNEGFATLFEYYGTDLVYPDMRYPDLMVVETVQSIMNNDGADNPRPMTHYIESNDDIDDIFDYVSYQKSGTVLRMMMLNLGRSTFLKGLSYYLSEMAYDSAVAEDLYSRLQRAITEDNTFTDGLTVKTIFDSWTLQGGFPIITVTRESASLVSVTQKKFMVNNADPNPSNFYIPITYATASQPDFESTVVQKWFIGNANKLDISVSTTDEEWIIFNKQQSGYYRVNYDDKNWKLIAKELKDGDYTKIHLLNRAQLLDDSLDLARLERLDVKIAMAITEYLAHETDYVPWAAAETSLNYFYDRLMYTNFGVEFKKIVRGWVDNLYQEYRVYESDKSVYFRILARNLAYRWACKVGHEDCEQDLGKVMSRVINDGAVLAKDYQSSVQCAGMRNIDDLTYKAYYNQFLETAESIRQSMITLLMCSQQKRHIEIILEDTLEGGLYSGSEKLTVYSQVAAKGHEFLNQLIDFMEANLQLVLSSFTAAQHQSLFNTISSVAYDESTIGRIRTLSVKFESYLGSSALEQMEVNFEDNLKWVTKFAEPIKEYFNGAATIFASIFAIVMPIFIFLYSN